jgi:hypothetical protein
LVGRYLQEPVFAQVWTMQKAVDARGATAGRADANQRAGHRRDPIQPAAVLLQ